ncbi:alpha-1,2-mannosyltransferase [Streptomyces sp. cf386]|uniref:glycosyltransferase 87 family protein n=1 Tax=Streptomyces sp. cf386 TaxID=1761904 RepID=UPI0008862369|nr:glycosyltransferase 87 family protein [Streptomyces sp. cf386]SDM68886.1 alpha-1,2-mannosyltransferase [Streptomyces sp. cf386]
MTRRSHSATPYSLLATSLLALLTLTAFSAFTTLCVHQRLPMADALVYRAEGEAVLRGGADLYGFTVTEWHLPATYPPFAALLFVPAALLPFAVLKAAFLAGNALLVAVLIHLSARLAGLTLDLPVRCAATALALWLEPVFQTLLFGQINLALACLVLWDLTRPSGARWKGVAIGVAAGIKLTPAIFIAYLLLRGRLREAGTATAAFAGTVVLGALALPSASLDFWTRRLYETDRVGKAWIVDNQSLQGLAARALGDAAPGPAWALPAAAVALTGLWLTARAARQSHALLLMAFTALLISPISWSHHWVWCVPLIAVLLAEGRLRTAWLVVVVFTARTMWLVPHEGALDLELPWWQQALAAPYPLLALAIACGSMISRCPNPSIHSIEQTGKSVCASRRFRSAGR